MNCPFCLQPATSSPFPPQEFFDVCVRVSCARCGDMVLTPEAIEELGFASPKLRSEYVKYFRMHRDGGPKSLFFEPDALPFVWLGTDPEQEDEDAHIRMGWVDLPGEDERYLSMLASKQRPCIDARPPICEFVVAEVVQMVGADDRFVTVVEPDESGGTIADTVRGAVVKRADGIRFETTALLRLWGTDGHGFRQVVQLGDEVAPRHVPKGSVVALYDASPAFRASTDDARPWWKFWG